MGKTVRFHNRLLTRTIVKNNIVRVFKMARPEEMVNWYDEAYSFAVRLSNQMLIDGHLKPFDNGLNKTIGVLAALSPMKRWEQNQILAQSLIETGKAGHMGTFVTKAQLIMMSDGTDEQILKILNGQKIKSFYLNIRYPERTDAVTIDRHAISIGLNEWVGAEDQAMSKNQYQFFVNTYKYAAEKLNVSPLHLQGVTWATWRRIKTNY